MIRKPLREYRFSLRARATTWYVGLLAVALTVFSIGIYIGIRTYLKVSLQRGLSSTAHTIASDFLARLPTKGDAWVLEKEIRESYELGSYRIDHYIRVSSGNEVLYQTADMRDPAIPISDIALPHPPSAGSSQRAPLIGDLVLPRLTTEGALLPPDDWRSRRDDLLFAVSGCGWPPHRD